MRPVWQVHCGPGQACATASRSACACAAISNCRDEFGLCTLRLAVNSASADVAMGIMVIEKLRVGAGLKKDAVLVGRLDHFVIWDKAVWEKQPTASITVEEALSAIGL